MMDQREAAAKFLWNSVLTFVYAHFCALAIDFVDMLFEKVEK